MAFPESVLDTRVELLLGGTWTNITNPYVYGREGNGINITYGRSDEGSSVDASRCSFEVDNTDGRFTPKNPNGAYYGLLKRGTPIRVSVHHDLPYLNIAGAVNENASTPDAAALDITGDIDVRIDFAPERWLDVTGTSETKEIMGKWRNSDRSWFLAFRGDAVFFEWSTTGANAVAASSTEIPNVPASGRIAIRVTLDVNNGASGHTVTFYTAPTMDDTWVQLGDPVVTAGTTSIFASASALRIGDPTDLTGSFVPVVAKVYKAEVRNGIGGTAVANPDFTAQAVGASSFVDAAGRTWTVNSPAEITNRDIRFSGNVVAWPSRWQTGTLDAHVPVVAAGPLRRIGQGVSPLRSALFRDYTSPDRQNIIAYWPMEDGVDATGFASAFPDHPAMSITGDVDLASFDSYGASEALPVVNNAVIAGNVPTYTSTGQTALRAFIQRPTTGPAADRGLMILETTGTAAKWIVWMEATTAELAIKAYDRDGTEILTTTFGAFFGNGIETHMIIELTQSGADINWALVGQDARGSILEAVLTLTNSGTLAGYTVGTVKRVRFGGNGDLAGVVIGHAVLADSIGAFTDTGSSMRAWRGEEAVKRFKRLMEEEEQAFSVFPGEWDTANDNQRMGNQGEATFLSLARTCEDVSSGILYEHRERAALALRDATSLYNQTPAITIDYEGSDGLVQPLEPDEDDQGLVNDMTIQRTSGSRYRVQKLTGALNINDPEDDADGVGPYEDSETLDLFTDNQPEQFAAWAVHLGTWDDARYPRIKILLQKATAMMPDVSAAVIGDIIAINNLPTLLTAPGQARQMIQGYSEFISQFRWEFTFNCTPAGGFYVAEAGQTDYIRADTGGSELAEALTTTEADVDVLTTSGPRWITTTEHASQFPFDVVFGGEVGTVTASASAVLDTFTRTVVDGWGSANTGQAWAQTGGVAADLDVTGTFGTVTLTAAPAPVVTRITSPSADFDMYVDVATAVLATGAQLEGGLVARFIDTSNQYILRATFETTAAINLELIEIVGGAGATLGTSTTTLTHVATTPYRMRFQGDGTALRAKIWLASATEPGTWLIDTTDASLTAAGSIGTRSQRATGNTNANAIIRYDNFELVNPQTFTVTRSVNGIVKTHTAGTAISLNHPARVGL